MNANYTECSGQQSQHVPETELLLHPPCAQPRSHREIRSIFVPGNTSRDIKLGQYKPMRKLKRRRKAAGSDLRAEFMVNQPNNEPLEQLLESSLFAGLRKQTSKQGWSTTSMGEPQPKGLGIHQPRERDSLPTPASASQHATRGMRRAGPLASIQEPSFRQRIEDVMYEWLIERSLSPSAQTCNAPYDEVLHWNKRGIRRHAELGNQIDRKSECNKAQREALFPLPLVILSTTSNSRTSFVEDEVVRRSENRIPIGCKICGKLSEHHEANRASITGLTEWNETLDHMHTHCRNNGRWAKASIKGLWSLLRYPSKLHRRLNSILQVLHEDAQPLLLGKFRGRYQLRPTDGQKQRRRKKDQDHGIKKERVCF